MDMLQWFSPLFWWDNTLEVEWRKIKGGRPCDVAGPRSESFANPLRCYTILLLNIKCYHNRGLEPIVSYDSTAQVYRSSEYPMITIGNPEYRELQKALFLKNKIIPEEVWLKPEDDAQWEKYPPSYVKKLEEDCSCYMISTDYGIESPPSSSTSQNPQTSSLFQDSQDPYDFSPLPLSQVDQQIVEAVQQWEQENPEPPRSRSDFTYYKDLDALSDSEFQCMNLSEP